jgi:hypothetical protein
MQLKQLIVFWGSNKEIMTSLIIDCFSLGNEGQHFIAPGAPPFALLIPTDVGNRVRCCRLPVQAGVY